MAIHLHVRLEVVVDDPYRLAVVSEFLLESITQPAPLDSFEACSGMKTKTSTLETIVAMGSDSKMVDGIDARDRMAARVSPARPAPTMAIFGGDMLLLRNTVESVLK